jgi:phage-related protein
MLCLARLLERSVYLLHDFIVEKKKAKTKTKQKIPFCMRRDAIKKSNKIANYSDMGIIARRLVYYPRIQRP